MLSSLSAKGNEKSLFNAVSFLRRFVVVVVIVVVVFLQTCAGHLQVL